MFQGGMWGHNPTFRHSVELFQVASFRIAGDCIVVRKLAPRRIESSFFDRSFGRGRVLFYIPGSKLPARMLGEGGEENTQFNGISPIRPYRNDLALREKC